MKKKTQLHQQVICQHTTILVYNSGMKGSLKSALLSEILKFLLRRVLTLDRSIGYMVKLKVSSLNNRTQKASGSGPKPLLWKQELQQHNRPKPFHHASDRAVSGWRSNTKRKLKKTKERWILISFEFHAGEISDFLKSESEKAFEGS